MNVSNRPIQRVAVIGTGYFSQFHLQGWRNIDGVEIVAVCDANMDKARVCAQQFSVPHAVSSTEDLYKLDHIDLIDIVTPPKSHHALVRESIGRGIATICQKPFATEYAQACELAHYSEAQNTPLIVHENFRFMPWYREMTRLMAQGMLGKLHNISFRLRTGDGQGADAYLARQPYFQTMPRLLVAETAVHFIDTFRYLCGEVKSVFAHLRRLNSNILGEDAGYIIFEFNQGTAGSFDGSRLNDHTADNPRRTFGEMWLEGEKGVLRLDGNANLYFKPHQAPEQLLTFNSGSYSQFGGGACQALQQHVVDCLGAGIKPENTAADYLRNLLIQEAVYASHLEKRRIDIDTFSPPLIPLNPF